MKFPRFRQWLDRNRWLWVMLGFDIGLASQFLIDHKHLYTGEAILLLLLPLYWAVEHEWYDPIPEWLESRPNLIVIPPNDPTAGIGRF